jgi:hypothetical protein
LCHRTPAGKGPACRLLRNVHVRAGVVWLHTVTLKETCSHLLETACV